MSGWFVEHVHGSAYELFLGPQSSASLIAGAIENPLIRLLRVDGPTIVLGSSQPDTVLRSGQTNPYAHIRRRSGGGAVWLDPAEQVWIDVIVPTTHPCWHPDVSTSFDWLGTVWAQAIQKLGVAETLNVHRGALTRSSWSALLCFAGVGPGEVFIRGRKTVGMSQRRSRYAALYQCGALLHWTIDPEMFAPSLIEHLDIAEVEKVGIGLDEVLHRSVSHAEVETAFLSALSGDAGETRANIANG
jgi:lipoate---protein ligase